jgi:hypothetical protein
VLRADVAVNSVVAALQSIPELVTELGGSQFITGHFYFSGQENALMRVLAQMSEPSMLLACHMQTFGSYDGQTAWKHAMQLIIRARNKATDPVTNRTSASHYDLYALAMNYPISVPYVAPNIRYVDLAGGNMWLAETSSPHFSDELGQDYLICPLIFNEMGDVGPDGVNFLCIGPAAETQGASNGR